MRQTCLTREKETFVTDTTDTPVSTEASAEQRPAASNGLAGLKLAQLQALASQLGITGGSRMRKSDLVEAISRHQRGGAVADREAAEKKTPRVCCRAAVPGRDRRDGPVRGRPRPHPTPPLPRSPC